MKFICPLILLLCASFASAGEVLITDIPANAKALLVKTDASGNIISVTVSSITIIKVGDPIPIPPVGDPPVGDFLQKLSAIPLASSSNERKAISAVYGSIVLNKDRLEIDSDAKLKTATDVLFSGAVNAMTNPGTWNSWKSSVDNLLKDMSLSEKLKSYETIRDYLDP